MAVVSGASITGPVGEKPGRFQGDFDAQFSPGQVAGIPFGTDSDGTPVDDHRVPVDLDGAREAALGAVVLEQVGQCLGVPEIIDADDLEFVAAGGQRPERDATNPTKPVDTYLDCHGVDS